MNDLVPIIKLEFNKIIDSIISEFIFEILSKLEIIILFLKIISQKFILIASKKL